MSLLVFNWKVIITFLIVLSKQEVLSQTRLDCKHYLMGKLCEGWNKGGMMIWLISDSVLIFPAARNKIPSTTNQSSANALFDKFCLIFTWLMLLF